MGRAPGSVCLLGSLLPVPPHPRHRLCYWPGAAASFGEGTVVVPGHGEITKASCCSQTGAGGGKVLAQPWPRPPGSAEAAGLTPREGGPLVPLLAVLTPQIKGLRTVTSTLLPRKFPFCCEACVPVSCAP